MADQFSLPAAQTSPGREGHADIVIIDRRR
jgi:hypothetical protein